MSIERPQAELEASVLWSFQTAPFHQREPVLGFLRSHHFQIEANRRLFDLIVKVHGEGLDPTPAVLLNVERMALDDGQLRGAYLDCMGATDWWGTLDSYARALVAIAPPETVQASGVGIDLNGQ